MRPAFWPWEVDTNRNLDCTEHWSPSFVTAARTYRFRGQKPATNLKGDATETSYVIVLLFISIGRLEAATADADGDIGRSLQLDHSKALDVYFPELYWSSFLGYVQKKRYRNKTDLYF